MAPPVGLLAKILGRGTMEDGYLYGQINSVSSWPKKRTQSAKAALAWAGLALPWPGLAWIMQRR